MVLRLFLLLAFLLSGFSAVAQNAATSYSDSEAAVDPKRPGYELIVDAKLVTDGQTIERGMVWRVFRERAAAGGELPIVANAEGGTASFTLNAGTYLVHAAFGRAGASKRVVLGEGGARETFVLQAGGLELDAVAGDKEIPTRFLRFSIYELEVDDSGERKLIAQNVAPRKVVQLNAGTYHVLSKFGNINATVRADLEVKAGNVTKAILQHRGAQLSLRLVSEPGGDPVANTAWTVFTQDGEKVFESRSVAPSLVLAEGTYEAVVRNGPKDFRKTFNVTSGKNARIEILLR